MAEAVPTTPEDQKSLLRNMRRYFREDMDEKLGDISANLLTHRAFCDQEFDSIQKTFSKHGKAIKENRAGINSLSEKVEDCATKVQEFGSIVADVETRVKHHDILIPKIISEKVKEFVEQEMAARLSEFERLQQKFGGAYISEADKPTEQDLYDLRRNFNVSKNAIGFKPVNKSDIDKIIRESQVNQEDAFRIAVADFLRWEMNFTPEFIANLESYYVQFIWDRVNTLYVVVTDAYASGLEQIKQEAWVLWTNKDDNKQTRELRRLDVPQYREYYRAMEQYCDGIRWEFKKTVPIEEWRKGKKRRTRIGETNDFDYIIQVKEHWETIYTTIEVPAHIRKSWPKIEVKKKSHVQYDMLYYRPIKPDRLPRTVKPRGREREEQPEEVIDGTKKYVHDIKVHIVNPHYQFVPGMVDPGAKTGTGSVTVKHNVKPFTPTSKQAELTSKTFEFTGNHAKLYPDLVSLEAASPAAMLHKNDPKKLPNILHQAAPPAAVEKVNKMTGNELNNLAAQIPKEMINLFSNQNDADSDTQDPTKNLGFDSLSLGSLAEDDETLKAPSTQSAPDNSMKESDAKKQRIEKNLEDFENTVLQRKQLDDDRERRSQIMRKPFEESMQEGAVNLPLRPPNISHIGGKVRQDDRLVANVDDIDNNGNPSNFTGAATVFGPFNQSTSQPSPVISKKKTEKKPSPKRGDKKVDDKKGADNIATNESTASPKAPTSSDPGVEPEPSKEPTKESTCDATDEDAGFTTADEEAVENLEETVINKTPPKAVTHDSVVSPPIGMNVFGLEIGQLPGQNNQLESSMSFVFKPQSTQLSELCDHSQIDDTKDDTNEGEGENHSIFRNLIKTPGSTAHHSPPLNTNNPGQPVYPLFNTPGRRISGANSPKPSDTTPILKKTFADIMKKKTGPQASVTKKIVKNMKLTDKVRQAKLEAASASKAGKCLDYFTKVDKRKETTSGFSDNPVNKDPRVKSPEFPQKTQIIREYTSPQDHEPYQPPSPSPDLTGAITDVQATPSKNVREELKKVFKEIDEDLAEDERKEQEMVKRATGKDSVEEINEEENETEITEVESAANSSSSLPNDQ